MTKFRILTTSMLLALALSSCEDTRVAGELEGTWTRGYVMPFEDGTKERIREQITFLRTDRDSKGGTFEEICTGEDELKEKQYIATYKWVSSIKGTWEISRKQLFEHYDISTLEVVLNKEDVKTELNPDYYFWNSDNLIMDAISLQSLHEELKQDTYKALYRSYSSLNRQDHKGRGYTDVQVKGNEFSYMSADMGRITFRR